MSKQKRTFIIITLLAAIIVAAVLVKKLSYAPLNLQAAQLLPQPKPMQQINLIHNGDPVTTDVLKGKWFLVFFGYTYCPDVCPLELQKLAEMLRTFEAQDIKYNPLVVFVSVDPERDTAKTLEAYAKHFHPHIVSVSGTNPELQKFAGFFGAAYSRNLSMNGKEYLVEAGADMPPGAGDQYIVNHSSRIFIVDPQGNYVGSFAPPHDAKLLFSDMQQLLEH